MSATAYPEQFDFSRMVTRAFDIGRRNLSILVTLTLILFGLPKLGATFLHNITGELPFFHYVFGLTSGVYWLIALFGYFALQAAIAHVFAADMNDRPASIGACLKTGINFLFPLFGICIVAGIGIFIGVLCLLIPGLFLATIWAVAAPTAVFERQDVGGALTRSARLTEGYRWQVFAVGAVFVVVSGVFHNAVDGDGVFRHAFGLFSVVNHAAHELAGVVMDTVFSLVGAMLTISTYYELRMLKEDAGPEDLATVLDPAPAYDGREDDHEFD